MTVQRTTPAPVTSGMAPRTRLLVSVMLLALALTMALLASPISPTSHVIGGPGGNSYEVMLRRSGGGTFVIYIMGPENLDFTSYKAENDQRITDWVNGSRRPPALADRPIKLTFYRPQSYADMMALFGTYVEAYINWRALGHSESHPEAALSGFGPPDPAIMGQPTEPVCWPSDDSEPCELATITGFIEVSFTLRSDVDLVALAALRDAPAVFLADTTAIQVFHDLDGSGISPRNVQDVVLPAARHDASVTYP